MITRFGKELRKLRIEHDEILKDMSTRLGVSPAFLSAVEVGKKNIPDGWVKKIADIYCLNERQEQILNVAAAESVTSVKIDLISSCNSQREAALLFARDFNSLPKETAQQIIHLLNQRNGIREGTSL